jgi:predicted MFS family arabinose efflux permease
VLLKIVYLLTCRELGVAVLVFRDDRAVISTVVTSRISHGTASGHPVGDALSSRFRLAFVITAALLAAAAVFALAIFRDEGRGEQINLAEVTRTRIES